MQLIVSTIGGDALLLGLLIFFWNWGLWDAVTCAGIFLFVLVGLLLIGVVVVPKINKSNTHAAMMESCFEVAPSLRTTLNNLDAEIDKWEANREKFVQMRSAAQTSSGRSLAESKLSKIDSMLADLNKKSDGVLGQVEMIAMESAGQFTDLDRKALENLSSRVEDSVQDARELREGLSGG